MVYIVINLLYYMLARERIRQDGDAGGELYD